MRTSVRGDLAFVVVEPLRDVAHTIAVKGPVEIFAHVTDVRRGEYLGEAAKGMLNGKRLQVEDVDGIAGNPLGSQSVEDGRLFHDGTSRSVDQPGRWFSMVGVEA
jgi:hypothetical protein